MDTFLTEEDSAFVKNEVQEIDITSTLISETYKITLDQSYSAPEVNANTTGVVQTVLIESKGYNAPFILSLYDTQTIILEMGATADDVQAALNDLPFLYPNLATVEESLAEGNYYKYFINLLR